jgi:hypothetical protein
MEPPLLEIMKASGLTLLEDWDGAMIADASKPKLRAVYQRANLSIEIFGFEQSGPLCFVLLEVRGRDNPLPELRKICQTKNWSLAEMCEDGEFLGLSVADERWKNWQRYLNFAIDDVS